LIEEDLKEFKLQIEKVDFDKISSKVKEENQNLDE